MCRMIRTYKVYGRNKNYIEGSITAQYEVDEGARHWMEFIPEGKQKYYKCHGKIALHGEVYEGPEPPNSQGKPYQLTSLQHQQVLLWVLRHSEENIEWEEVKVVQLSGFLHQGERFLEYGLVLSTTCLRDNT
ncbi:hypothetical protein C5167_026782 [Papaver somniferum]|nr:hypothetical protein C5167_026782 [Papaver somniferum]